MKITRENILSLLQPTIEEAKNVDWTNKEVYANWSAQTYHFVIHSTRLFCFAAGKTPKDANDVHIRFLKHMWEEKGHENLAMTDVKNLGFNITDFPELPSTAALYQSQYYWINEVSAYSFFGYLIALEGLAVYGGHVVRSAVDPVYAKNSTKFIKVHCEEDQAHLEEVFEWIEKIPESEQENVYQNFVKSLAHYSSMLREISASALASKKSA